MSLFAATSQITIKIINEEKTINDSNLFLFLKVKYASKKTTASKIIRAGVKIYPCILLWNIKLRVIGFNIKRITI